MTTLYDFPKLYDLVVAPGPCEDFYCGLARRSGGAILELACGTGRLTLPLGRAGHRVVGLDASGPMLVRARSKAALEGLRISFVEGDLRDFRLDARFDLVIVSCNSLAHLTTNADLATCLRQVHRHLRPGGLLAFDVVNPKIGQLAEAEAKPGTISRPLGEGYRLVMEEAAPYDPIRQVRRMCWRIGREGAAAADLASMPLRIIHPQELPLHLELAGLRLVSRYGDFDGKPLMPSSDNQVCLAALA